MVKGVIEKLALEEYDRCGEIWDMKKFPYTEQFRREIAAGNRVVYIYKENGAFLGEIAYVLHMDAPDYTIENRRIYISRLLVKSTHRGRGIGSALLDFVLAEVQKQGFTEASVGVDKANAAARHLYRKKGFTTVLFDGEDEAGAYVKLLKKL